MVFGATNAHAVINTTYCNIGNPFFSHQKCPTGYVSPFYAEGWGDTMVVSGMTIRRVNAILGTAPGAISATGHGVRSNGTAIAGCQVTAYSVVQQFSISSNCNEATRIAVTSVRNS